MNPQIVFLCTCLNIIICTHFQIVDTTDGRVSLFFLIIFRCVSDLTVKVELKQKNILSPNSE